jgi:hypothetical protein
MFLALLKLDKTIDFYMMKKEDLPLSALKAQKLTSNLLKLLKKL